MSVEDRCDDRPASGASGTYVLPLAGEYDAANAHHIRDRGSEAVRLPWVRSIVVDLADVTFLDSAALGAIIEIRTAAHLVEIPLTVRDAAPRVWRLFEMMGIGEIFDPTR